MTVSLAFVIVIFLIYLVYSLLARKSDPKLPPGPRPYPLIGNILEIHREGLDTIVKKYRKKYGDIFCMYFFHKKMIVFSGLDVLKDAFVKNGQIFSERPNMPFGENKGIMTANGKLWKENRRIAVQMLHDLGMGSNTLQVKVHEEIETFLSYVETFEGKEFDLNMILKVAVANIIYSIVLGKRFSYDDSDAIERIHEMEKCANDPNTLIGFEILKYFPGDPFGTRVFLERSEKLRKNYDEMVEESLKRYDKHCISDLIDVYIKEMSKKISDGSIDAIDYVDLRMILINLTVAGSETSATALQWGLLHFLRSPEIQTKIYNEIQDNVPTDCLPDLADRRKLPFVEATVMEVLRHGNITPLSVPHAVATDCVFRGYHIPSDAYVLPNIQSVLFDDSIWKDPYKFSPERFIGQDGTIVQSEYLIPFSLGRRSCLGESLGRMEVFLFLSALVQHFEFLPPEGKDPPELEGLYGITRGPKPFLTRIKKRRS